MILGLAEKVLGRKKLFINDDVTTVPTVRTYVNTAGITSFSKMVFTVPKKSYCVNCMCWFLLKLAFPCTCKSDYLKPMKRISCTPQDIFKNRHPKCYYLKSKVSTGKRIPALYKYPRVQN